MRGRVKGMICTVEGCNKPVLAKGLCSPHWQRQYKHGNLEKLTMHGFSVMDRIMAKVVMNEEGCWIFMGATAGGYGMIGIDGRTKGVHVVTYEDKYGPVPPGLELDHFVCSNKLCCNPDHVEPVTRSINALRWRAAKRDE